MHWLKPLPVALLPVTLLTTSCALLEDEQEIPLSEVPPAVLAAAQQAVPGIVIEEAELEKEDGQTVYELSGSADGREYEIEISGTGEILEVEED